MANQNPTPGWEVNLEQLLAMRHQPLKLPEQATRPARASRNGSYQSRRHGRGMEFAESRHYQHGDDIRAIDWRITARTGKTHTKLFQEEKERPVFILVDYSPSMHFGSQFRFKSVQAAHLAAGLAWQAVARGDRLGGLIFNQQHHVELKPRSRRQAALALLNQLVDKLPRQLASVSVSDPAPDQRQVLPNLLATNCQRLNRLLPPGSQVYVLSDFYQLNAQCVKQLSLLCRHSQVTAIELYDPLERELPQQATRLGLEITDGRRVSRLHSSSQQRLQIQQAERHARLAKLPLCHWQVGAHVPLSEIDHGPA